MDILKAMEERHSVRAYTDKPIEGDTLSRLQKAVARANAESGLHIQLVLNEPKAFDSRIGCKLIDFTGKRKPDFRCDIIGVDVADLNCFDLCHFFQIRHSEQQFFSCQYTGYISGGFSLFSDTGNRSTCGQDHNFPFPIMAGGFTGRFRNGGDKRQKHNKTKHKNHCFFHFLFPLSSWHHKFRLLTVT